MKKHEILVKSMGFFTWFIGSKKRHFFGEMMVVCAQKGQKWHCGGINRMCYNFIFNLDCTYRLEPCLTKRSELNTWTQIRSKMPDVKGPIMFDKLTKHYR